MVKSYRIISIQERQKGQGCRMKQYPLLELDSPIVYKARCMNYEAQIWKISEKWYSDFRS